MQDHNHPSLPPFLNLLMSAASITFLFISNSISTDEFRIWSSWGLGFILFIVQMLVNWDKMIAQFKKCVEAIKKCFK